MHDFITNPVVWMIAATMVGYVAVRIWLDSRCPECRERRALEPTGHEQAGDFFKRAQTQWRCKYCGHEVWKKNPDDA